MVDHVKLTLLGALLIWPICSALEQAQPPQQRQRRSYAERTAARRKRTNQLLEHIESPLDAYTSLDEALQGVDDFTLMHASPSVDWESVGSELDPQKGGKLGGTLRGRRKRVQIEAFLYLCRQIIGTTDKGFIIDAGSGAGNLAIPLAGILQQTVLAIDSNRRSLKRLHDRAVEIPNCLVETQCADLASASLSLPATTSVICSLHACGAATDMAIRLATRHRLPFVMSPCCTGKVNTPRSDFSRNRYGMLETKSDDTAATARSGSLEDITYPRSSWLQRALEEGQMSDGEAKTSAQHYTTLAKVADVGLGPQTPKEQVRHQSLAKYAVEMDRLLGVAEQHGYKVQLYRMERLGDYGKLDVLVGLPMEHPASKLLSFMENMKLQPVN